MYVSGTLSWNRSDIELTKYTVGFLRWSGSGRPAEDMAGLKAAAGEKLADVAQKIAELERVRDGLETVIAACPGHGALAQCPILAALSGDRA